MLVEMVGGFWRICRWSGGVVALGVPPPAFIHSFIHLLENGIRIVLIFDS